jgi:hypothetical protein
MDSELRGFPPIAVEALEALPPHVAAHDRRRVVHFHVTEQPTTRRTARQVLEAFPSGTPPLFLLRDREGVCGADFRRWVEPMGIEEVRALRDAGGGGNRTRV